MNNYFFRLTIALLIVFKTTSIVIAQQNVGIGTLTPNAKAILELQANNKGFLVPRVTTAERLAIAPAASEQALLVYDINDNLFYYWDGTQWIGFPQTGGSNNISLNYDSTTNVLSITDAGGTLNTTLNINNSDNDNDSINELITGVVFNANGNILTINEAGNTWNTAISINDPDNNPTNEFNTALSYNSSTNILSVTDAGGTINANLTPLTTPSWGNIIGIPNNGNFIFNTTAQQAGANFNIENNGVIGGTLNVNGRTNANAGISAAGANNNLFSSTFGGQNWLPFTNGFNYFSSDNHFFRANSNSGLMMTVNNTGIDVTNDVDATRDVTAGRDMEVGRDIRITSRTFVGDQGIFFPTSYDVRNAPDDAFHDCNNFISFRDCNTNNGLSEDFLGYQSNDFYFRDSDGGSDITQPEVFAQGFNSYSSGRWKTNIQPMTGALGKVMQLRGVTYNYIPTINDGKKDFGFIAEEVYEVLPEIVGINPEIGIAGLDYGHVTPVLVEAIKEQQLLIEKLKNENTSVKTEVEILKAEMEQLKSYLYQQSKK